MLPVLKIIILGTAYFDRVVCFLPAFKGAYLHIIRTIMINTIIITSDLNSSS